MFFTDLLSARIVRESLFINDGCNRKCRYAFVKKLGNFLVPTIENVEEVWIRVF